jgi:hypothetical protein
MFSAAVQMQRPGPQAGSTNLPKDVEIVAVPRDQALIEEKSLAAAPSTVRTASNSASGSLIGGLRAYRFHLEAGETASFRLKAEGGANMAMSLADPVTANAFSAQIRAVNRQPRPMRSSRLEFKNGSAEPYELTLLVLGAVNYAYTINIEYKK